MAENKPADNCEACRNHPTFCVLNDPFHQDRVLGDALGDQEDALLDPQPPHNGTVPNFLENKTNSSHPLCKVLF